MNPDDEAVEEFEPAYSTYLIVGRRMVRIILKATDALLLSAGDQTEVELEVTLETKNSEEAVRVDDAYIEITFLDYLAMFEPSEEDEETDDDFDLSELTDYAEREWDLN